MKKLMTALPLFLGLAANAQLNGVVALKSADRTIMRFFEGKTMDFINSYGQEVSGTVQRVADDTLYLTFYNVGQVANQWGLPSMDTLNVVPLAYRFEDIKAIIRYRNKFNYIADGSVLVGAAIALLVAAIVNTNSSTPGSTTVFSQGDIYGSIGLAGLGVFLFTQQKRVYHLGKRFHLVYYGFPTPKTGTPQG